jgi:hypothetical protein
MDDNPNNAHRVISEGVSGMSMPWVVPLHLVSQEIKSRLDDTDSFDLLVYSSSQCQDR